MRILLLVVVVCSLCLEGTSRDLMIVFGIVKDWETGRKMKEYKVTVTDINDPTFTVVASLNRAGKYEIRLNELREYLITWSSPGYVSKSVLLSTGEPEEKDRRAGFGMQIDATLMKFKEGVDYSAMDVPFGKAQYDPVKKFYVWDMVYVKEMREKQQQLIDEFRNR